ncbi:MAG: DUF4411 family protein [Arachnia sp.]
MYLMDSNAFMEASRTYYGFDIAPGFWTWLGDPALRGKVGSIDAVKEEITAGTGDLVAWAHALPSSFWLPDTAETLDAMRDLAAWATGPARQYRQSAIDEFLASADFKLIAHAIATKATLITREQPAPDSVRRVKIPDACNALGVAWDDPFGLYRALGMRLVT